jgi:hypothetical protein
MALGSDGSSGAYIGTLDNYPVRFLLNSAEQMRLTSTGLGIGTSSPGQKLEVAGNILINTSGNPTMTVKTSGAGNNPGYLLTADTNTWGMYGIFSDANDTLQWQYNGTTRLTLTNDGNLGLGVTPSAWVEGVGLNVGSGRGGSIFTETVNFGFTTFNANAFYSSTSTWKYVTSNAASRYQQLNGVHSWYNAPSGTAGNVISFTQAMTLDASGNLSLGQTSSALQSGGTGITLYGSSNSEIKFLNSSTGSASTDGTALLTSSTDFVINNREAGAITFGTNNTERARITSGGYFKASNAGTYQNATAAYHELRQTASDWIGYFVNTNATPYGIQVGHITDANSTGSPFFQCTAGAALGTLRAEIRSNGGLANYSGNDVNLSDRREKTNFAPAKSYLDTICAIPVQTFNYIDQNLEEDPGLTLGVVAQDVQAVAPELVMESNWGTAEEPKQRLSIYQTDLQYALMKCVQELKAELDSVKAELATLKGQP